MTAFIKINTVVFVLLLLAEYLTCQTFTGLSFVPGTRVTSTSNSGIVQVTFTPSGGTAVTGTICNNVFTNLYASVLCNSMGFGTIGAQVVSNPASAGALPIAAVNFQCTLANAATPSTMLIQYCSANAYSTASPCTHNNDVSIICLTAGTNPASSSTTAITTIATTSTTTAPPSITCPSTVVVLSGGTSGIVTIVSGTNVQTICASDITVATAQVLCNTACSPVSVTNVYAKPVYAGTSTLPATTTPTAVLLNFACTGTTYATCAGTANSVLTSCPASQLLSLYCGPVATSTPSAPVPPTVTCNGPTAIVFFAAATDPTATPSLFSLAPIAGFTTPASCQFSSTQNAAAPLGVTVSFVFTQCGAVAAVSANSFSYTTNILRNPTANANGANFDASITIPITCVIPKNGTVQGAVTPVPPVQPPIISSDALNTVVTLYSSWDMTPASQLLSTSSALLGTIIYVKVTQTSTLPNLKLIVNSCSVSPTNNQADTAARQIITAKCPNPAASDLNVQMSPLSATVISFQYKAFRASSSNSVTNYVFCNTYTCNTLPAPGDPSTQCSRACNSRRKRSDDYERSIDDIVVSEPVFIVG